MHGAAAGDREATDALDMVVYGDLACPYSALATYRVTWLGATRRARVDLRLVHGRADLFTEPASRRRLAEEVEEVRSLVTAGPVFPIRPPAELPDVTTATARYAEHHRRRDQVRQVRVRLFRALWMQGLDIGDERVLDRLGVTAQPAPEVVRTWQQAWEALEEPVVPMVVLPDGGLHRGRDALDFLLELRAPRSPESGRQLT